MNFSTYNLRPKTPDFFYTLMNYCHVLQFLFADNVKITNSEKEYLYFDRKKALSTNLQTAVTDIVF